MAARGAPRRPRRGPAPIASFDHDGSGESSPENKQAPRLPEIREDLACSTASVAAESTHDALAPPEPRARSHSSPAGLPPAGPPGPAPPSPAPFGPAPPGPAPSGLAPSGPSGAAPRIDISRASSSSHHDSRESSPELALFAGTADDARAALALGFREDGALELRSSTEELAFLEPAPAPARRAPRRDSQGSEAALLAVSGRTSRLSSVGSQCSAHSALSGFGRVSRLSVASGASGASRSPSPHKMLLETSFCGPKPIDADPEICAAAVEERLLELAKLATAAAPAVDARDRREVRTEATVESARPASAPPPAAPAAAAADDKRAKEDRNRAKVEERRARSRERREPSRPEVYEPENQTKDIIRIKLKPDDEYDTNDELESERTVVSREPARKPVTLELNDRPARTAELASPQATLRRPRDSRTPSPVGAPVSRKSSFCSLFKSRETITSPDSPSDALRRKKSLNDGRSRSKSRDRSATPTSASKIKGSVLSLFKTPRKSVASPSPSSRDVSPVVQHQRQFPQPPVDRQRGERLKYYEESKNGIIHIPLRTPPDELSSADEPTARAGRPASAPQPRAPPERRTVLPDGSIIIPLHSPTEKTAAAFTGSAVKIESTSKYEPELDLEIAVSASECEPAVDAGVADAPELDVRTAAETSPPAGGAPAPAAAGRPGKKERIIFSTHVGSEEQVFSTQFSITKTPSVTSEISESIPSFPESEEVRPSEPPRAGSSPAEDAADDAGPGSSGSEGASEAGSDAERRGLVPQESFEELPYVPTTLPLERPLALPMVPVRERGGVRVAGRQRPRAWAAGAALGALAAPAPAAAAAPAPPAERLHIRLPRAAPPAAARVRERSGSDANGATETRGKGEWIDFSEVPERRKQPKRIQTLPAARDAVLFSYVPPERCRCECHAHAAPRDDELPLLAARVPPADASPGAEPPDDVPPDDDGRAAPFTADLDLHRNHTETARPHDAGRTPLTSPRV